MEKKAMPGENGVKEAYAMWVRASVGAHQCGRRSAPLLNRNRARRAAGKGKLRFAVGTRSLSGLAGAGSLAICAAVLAGCAGPPRPRSHPDAAAQRHIHTIAEELPADSRLRNELEAGAHGSGVRLAWMDAMRRQGVKRAKAATEFFGLGRPVYVKVARMVYFSEYDDSSCSQIADAKQLSQIRTSGLEVQLRRAAIEGTIGAHRLPVDKLVMDLHGRGFIDLLADEWLPASAVLMSFPERNIDPLAQSVAIGDLADVMARLKRGVDPGVRDAAMPIAIIDDDYCMTTALLRAGADPKLPAQDGSTLLMTAVRNNALSSAKALLEAGADVNATAKFPSPKLGGTALSWAVGTGEQEMIRLLRGAGARQ